MHNNLELEAVTLNIIRDHGSRRLGKGCLCGWESYGPNEGHDLHLAEKIAERLDDGMPGTPKYNDRHVTTMAKMLIEDDRVHTKYPKSIAMTLLSALLPMIRIEDLAGWKAHGDTIDQAMLGG